MSEKASYSCHTNVENYPCDWPVLLHPLPLNRMAPFLTALVCSGGFNTIPQTGWLVNNINLSPAVQEVGLSKIEVPPDSVSSEACFLIHP